MSWTPKTAYIVSHTHWDREWYLTYEEFRVNMMRVVDRVLTALETDETFVHFLLDGQSVLLEDYLEVRPEERPTLALMRSQILQLLESYLIVIRTIRTLKTNIRKKEFLKRALKTGTMLYRKGDIERPEAISEVSFANAIRYALERGILREFTGLGGEGAKKKGRSELVFYWPKEGEELLERDEAAIRRLLD